MNSFWLEKLEAIRFHGKPESTIPRIYSTILKTSENKRTEVIIFFWLKKKFVIKVEIPKKIEINAGIQIIDIGIKNLKLLSNVREIDIQYKLQIKYPNPKNHP